MHALRAPREAVSIGQYAAVSLNTASPAQHIPVIDSLVPIQKNSSVIPSDHKKSTSAVLSIVLPFVLLAAIVAIIFFVVRYAMHRAAVKRRRQASWILRLGQWNTESKRTDARETQTGFSHASSAFSAYPYPLSEHYQ